MILSTHDMSVAESMCDYIFMIFKGKKVLDGTLASIQNQYGSDTIRVSTEGGFAAVQDLPGVDKIRDLGQSQELRMAQGCDPQQVLRALVSRTSVTSFSIVKPSLHDIFVRIAGPGRRGGAMLHRILLIAKRDYVASVMRKAFLIGLVLRRLMFGGGLFGVALLRVTDGNKDKRIAILDRTGVAASAIIQAAEEGLNRLTALDNAAPLVGHYVFEAVPAEDGDPNGTAAHSFGPRASRRSCRVP